MVADDGLKSGLDTSWLRREGGDGQGGGHRAVRATQGRRNVVKVLRWLIIRIFGATMAPVGARNAS